MLPHTTHMTLYSDRAKLDVAAAAATEWFASRLLSPGDEQRGAIGADCHAVDWPSCSRTQVSSRSTYSTMSPVLNCAGRTSQVYVSIST